jgi:beta-alanine--pyruvate transaminase
MTLDNETRLQRTALDALVDSDRQHHWHPFTDMRAFDPATRMLVRARDCTVWDADGRPLLDAFAGLWSVNAGHNHPRIVAAIIDQVQQLAVGPLFNFTHPTAAELAARLAALCPDDLNKVFFSVQGSHAVDQALKLARQYWKSVGQGTKYKIIARDRAYHGTAFGGTSAQGIAANREAFEPLLPGFSHITAPLPGNTCRMCRSSCTLLCADELEREILRQGPSTVAAYIVEPLSGTGGVIPSPAGYLERIAEICKRHRVLFIADEVMTGFGRTGRMFAIEHSNVVPDIMVVSKGLTSGHLPMAAMIVREQIYDAIVSSATRPGVEFSSGSTFDGYPAACAAALANLDVIRDEDLVGQAQQKGAVLQECLARLKTHALVRDVRGIGMVGGIELTEAKAQQVAMHCYERGVIVRPLVGGRVVAVAPPLTITVVDLHRIAETLAAALDDCHTSASEPATE